MNITNFQELGLKEELFEAINAMGFTEPTEIQQKAIPQLLATENDFVGQAQTGTGKTVAFGIPLIEKINPHTKTVQALVLAPTRELAMQIGVECNKFCASSGIKTVCVYGGQGKIDFMTYCLIVIDII